jgi:hypothetical protein
VKTIADNIRTQFTENQQQEIVLSLQGKHEIADLKAVIKSGKKLSVEIKPYRASRSLDSNAYLWVLLSKLADILHSSKDELYLLMLERYGVFTHVIVKLAAVDRIIREWRTVRNLGEVHINGQTGVQLQCYFGSSTYDSKEMSVLIDGVVSECKEVGIETLPPDELARMNEEWRK